MDFTSALGNGNHSGNGKPPSGIDAFDAAEPAPEYKPIPPGIYFGRVLRGWYDVTKTKGEDAYRMRFEVTEGEHAGKTIPRTWTFGPKALGYTKLALAPFGLTTKAQLFLPFPEAGREYHCRLVVAVQRGDDGIERNDIKRIDVLRIVDSPAAAFMLPEQGEGGPK